MKKDIRQFRIVSTLQIGPSSCLQIHIQISIELDRSVRNHRDRFLLFQAISIDRRSQTMNRSEKLMREKI